MGSHKQTALESKSVPSRMLRQARRLSGVASAIAQNLPNIAGFLADDERYAVSLKVYLKDDGYLGIAERFDEDHVDVVFASGDGILETLDGLNAAMAADKWKRSKYYD